MNLAADGISNVKLGSPFEMDCGVGREGINKIRVELLVLWRSRAPCSGRHHE